MFKRKDKTLFCDRCKVQYEAPRADIVQRFRNLCQPHRDEAEALQRRKDAVAAWAATYWLQLEPLAQAWPRHPMEQQVGQLRNMYASGGSGGMG